MRSCCLSRGTLEHAAGALTLLRQALHRVVTATERLTRVSKRRGLVLFPMLLGYSEHNAPSAMRSTKNGIRSYMYIPLSLPLLLDGLYENVLDGYVLSTLLMDFTSTNAAEPSRMRSIA